MRQRTLQNSQSSEVEEQSSMLLESCDVYGQGRVETIVHIDQEVVLIEQRSPTTSFFIPLRSSQAKERLKGILALSTRIM
jgi:hypothetical protein